ncbi:MAG: response regulator [Bacteroidales bacterium]
MSLKRILIVEDHLPYRILINEWLKRSEYFYNIVSSGEAALKALELTSYHLIVSDLFMPDMSGIMLAGIVAEKYKTPFVIITSNTLFDVKHYVFENKYAKPIDAQTFISIIEKHIK